MTTDPAELVATVLGLDGRQRDAYLLSLSDDERLLLDRLLEDHRSGTGDLPAVAFLHDPVGWVDAFTDLELTVYQVEALQSLVRNKRHAVRGPHGLGKSFLAALVILWFATTSEAAGRSWKVGSTASVWRQLTKFLWPEVRALSKHIDWEALGMAPWVRYEQLLDLSIKLELGEAFAAASDIPENLEGLHAQRVLYVYDESKTIPPETWEATEGAFSTAGDDTGDEAYALAVSTPGAQSGTFYDIHKRKPGYEDWSTQHVTLDEAVAAGRISRLWAEQRERQWGVGSAVFRNRVLGEFAADDERSLIPLSWVEAAVERWHAWNDAGAVPPTSLVELGVDVARHGSDSTVVAHINGHVVMRVDREKYTDNVSELGDRVAQLCGLSGVASVDADGMGAGTADRLRTLLGDVRVTVFHGAPRPKEWRDRSGELEAFNTRAAAWWNLRELLDPAWGPVLCLPPDDELIGDLVGPERVYDGGNRIKLEAKEQTKKRLSRSPDVGDGVVIGLWRRCAPRPAVEWSASVDWANNREPAPTPNQPPNQPAQQEPAPVVPEVWTRP